VIFSFLTVALFLAMKKNWPAVYLYFEVNIYRILRENIIKVKLFL